MNLFDFHSKKYIPTLKIHYWKSILKTGKELKPKMKGDLKMEVRFINFVREVTHKEVETIEMNGTMENLLDYECLEYGTELRNRIYDHGKLSDEVEILLNGRIIDHDSCLKKKVSDEDRVCISGSSHWH